MLAAIRLFKGIIVLEITLLIAGFRFSFFSEKKLKLDRELDNFITFSSENPDIIIRISRDWDHFVFPVLPQAGEDRICRYYKQKDTLYCVTRGNDKDSLACAVYRPECREIRCILNEKAFRMPPDNLGSILRMIPLRAVFQYLGVLFLHAAAISYKDKEILFSAPSGIGKTTQAKLWNTYRDAEILCNDRTLLRAENNIWHSYGYPMDGSEPVRSNKKVFLGAVVLLEQGMENHVERLNPSRGATLLMEQTVIDVWNPNARMLAMDKILALMKDIPVYRLTCTPEKDAVKVLEAQLKKDGVISDE